MKASSSPEVELRPDETVDAFMDGALRLIQAKDGYRFSIDAILLAEFAAVKPDDLVVDLGTGCGVMLLILLLQKPVGFALGMEIQKELAAQAARNAALNGFQDKMEVIRADMKALPLARGCADVVICNPPYRRVKGGRINPDPRRAVARHEILASPDDIMRAAAWLLKRKGRFAIVYPAERLVDAVMRMRRAGMEPKRIQMVHPRLESGAKLALIEGLLGGKPGVKIKPPVFGQGKFSFK